MKRSHRIAMLILLVLSALLFYAVGIFTIRPDRISGNGNLGIIPITLAAPLYIVFLILFGMAVYANAARWQRGGLLVMLAVFAAVCAVCVYGEVQYTRDLIQELGGWDDPESRLYRYPLLNQYTNTLFFNIHTFIGGMMTAALLSAAAALAAKSRGRGAD